MTELAMPRNVSAVLDKAKKEGKGAFLILGGEMQTPTAYRTTLEQAWKQAMSGNGVSSSVRASAYSISAVGFSATNFAAQVLSEIPLMVAGRTGDESDWNPINYFMSTSSNLFWHIEAALKIYGVCYLRKVYNEYRYPTGLEWMHPDDVTPQTDMYGNVTEYYIEAVRYMPRQMVEIRTFDPDRSLQGKGEFEVALSRMTTEQSIVRHAGSFFFNAARPDGMLVSKTKMNRVEVKQAQAEWAKFKGSKNAWSTFVSSGQWEWIPITGSPVDLAMVDLSTDIKRDICAIMRVNPALLGFSDVSDPLSAGATMHEILRNYIENVALPRHKWVCQHLNEQWLYPDFGHGDMYSLTANRAKMPILSDVTNDRANTAVAITGVGSVVADYDETRKTMGLAVREDYFVRNPSEALTVWNNTGMMYDEFRKAIGLKPVGIQLGGATVKLMDGRLVNLYDIAAIALANRKAIELTGQAPPPPSFGGGMFGQSAPTPPTPPAPAAPAPMIPTTTMSNATVGKLARLIIKSGKRSSNVGMGGGSGACAVLLSMPNDERLTAIQTIIKSMPFPSDGIPPEFVEPGDFHVTVLYADSFTVQAEPNIYPVLTDNPPMTLQTDKLFMFPPGKDGKAPLVMLIDTKSDGGIALMDFQRKVYEAMLKAEPGAMLSDYSDPAKYTPHATIAYVDPSYVVPDLMVQVDVCPETVQFSREVYEITFEQPATPDQQTTIDDPPAVEQTAPPTQRSAMPIVLSVVWPENNFILMAQRMAARAIQEQDITAVDWNAPANWRIDLTGLNGTAGDANRLLNELTFNDAAHIDLTAYSFALNGDSIYLMCNPSEGLNRLRESARLSLEDVGYRTEDTPYIPGVKLGTVRADELQPLQLMGVYNALKDASENLGMPLVAGAITLTVNDEPRNTWGLRSHTSAQAKELNDWKRKATGRRSADAPFVTDALNGTLVEAYIRSSLAGVEPDDKDTVKEIFIRAGELLKGGIEYRDIPDAPEEYQSYWQNFDELGHDLGAAWSSYMSEALDPILSGIEKDVAPTTVYGLLNKFHAGLSNAWVGTPETPGDLTKLVLAGMAAGNQALTAATSMKPVRAGSPSFAFVIDWNVMSQEALDFARQYSFDLIRKLDKTTQVLVQEAFADWIKSGEPTSGLAKRLTPIFKDAVRAASIAQTESIRVYNNGAFERWQRVGVKKAIWRTVQDGHVCPICRPLNGQVAAFTTGWTHPGGSYIDPYDNKRVESDKFRGQVFTDSAHTRCRCYRRPYVE